MGKQENRGTRRTKLRMETAMIELLKEKSIEKITVRELIERADVIGFLLDDGRKSDWVIEIKTSHMPEAQILGSAIGQKVVDQVPYMIGLNRWLGDTLTQEIKDYLKNMGAAAASNGAVGLYHVDHLTSEAVEQGESLIRPSAKHYVIDEAELQRVKNNYPCIWKEPEKDPQLCFLGCPHFSEIEILDCLSRIDKKSTNNRRKKLRFQPSLR